MINATHYKTSCQEYIILALLVDKYDDRLWHANWPALSGPRIYRPMTQGMACMMEPYHILCSCVMAPMLSRGSTAQVEVVPTFAHTKNGIRPASRSAAIVVAKISGGKAQSLAPVQSRAVLNVVNHLLKSAADNLAVQNPLKPGQHGTQVSNKPEGQFGTL